MSTHLQIVCDGCGLKGEIHKNAGQTIFLIRGALDFRGWKTNNKTGKDYCPKCKETKCPRPAKKP